MAASDQIFARLKRAQGLVVRDVRHLMPSARPHLKYFDPLGQRRLIVVHYDAERRPAIYDPVARYQAQGRYHINRNWAASGETPVYGFGLMYHLKIAYNGDVYITQPLELRTWQARNANAQAIGVCVDCGPDQEPTPEQVASLRKLLGFLCFYCPEFPAGRDDCWGHGELGPKGPGPNFGNSTNCPGRVLPHVVKWRNG